MKSNFLTPFLQDGLVLQCTEHWHLEELENAGVYGVSKLDAQSLPMYIKLYKHPRLGYDFTWTQEPNLFLGTIKFTQLVKFDEFYNQHNNQEEVVRTNSNFTARDVLNELYILKQENGDINELFNFFVSNDVDKMLDYLYENKMERLNEKENMEL